jgi:phage terminase large subunit
LSTLNIPTARVFEPLLGPSRYKGARGGRGSGKSHFFAENLVDRHTEQGLRSVCIRENQKSLKDSAKRLIEDKILQLNLTARHGFKVFKEVIETPGDGVILFQGMQDHTAESIKSLEGFNIAWVEEAQTMSANSLKLLRPTIRAPESELWFSWNPRRKMDPIDVLLAQGTPPTDSVLVTANWNDNPWFPSVLEQERLDCLNADPDQYDHIWEGGYISVADGAYWAGPLAKAKLEGRIGKVAPDPLLPIKMFCDIGGTGAKSDAFAMWAAQFVAREVRVLDYYEAQGQPLAAHLAWLRENDYGPDNAEIILPHDGSTNDRVYDVSYETAFRGAGYRVEVIPNQGRGAANARIEAARKLFPSIWFNEDTTVGGRETLGWYHERRDDHRSIGLGPDHDWSSHGADAFGLMAVAYKPPRANNQDLTKAREQSRARSRSHYE